MGITGSDLLEESGVETDIRMRLGVGRCRLAVCVPDHITLASAAELDGKRVATSFPHITSRYLAKHDASAHLVLLERLHGLGVVVLVAP